MRTAMVWMPSTACSQSPGTDAGMKAWRPEAERQVPTPFLMSFYTKAPFPPFPACIRLLHVHGPSRSYLPRDQGIVPAMDAQISEKGASLKNRQDGA